jgi:sigma54-dependent transcription regulator
MSTDLCKPHTIGLDQSRYDEITKRFTCEREDATEAATRVDHFDAVQLATVLRTCRQYDTASAGRGTCR